jgi:phosphatidylserine/phosphatidylglycerophosphate/cardiolipin synthase-like enzyme
MSDDTSVPILRAIHVAKKSIRVKVLLFSDPELLSAVIEAKKRGVNVRVMLNPALRSGESENEEAASSRKTGRDRVGHGGIQFRPGVALQSIRSTSFHGFSRS